MIWFHGLLGGFIGGGANAAIAVLGVAAANAIGVKVAALDLRQIGIVFVSGGLASAFAYLKTSPLPPLATTDTEQTEKP